MAGIESVKGKLSVVFFLYVSYL